MKIFWDVDGTITGLVEGDSTETPTLRPYAAEVIRMLEGLGVENYIWGADKAVAEKLADSLELPTGRSFKKPDVNFVEELWNLPVTPDLVVDDDPHDPVLAFPHFVVTPYEGHEDHDLLDIVPDIREHYDAFNPEEHLIEVRVKFSRKRRVPARIRMKRRKYYRRRKGYYKRYRRRYRRRPQTKRLAKIKKRIKKRFKRRGGRFRMRISL